MVSRLSGKELESTVVKQRFLVNNFGVRTNHLWSEKKRGGGETKDKTYTLFEEKKENIGLYSNQILRLQLVPWE